MKLNELRIGNWLQRLDGSIFQVSASDFTIIENIPEHLGPAPIPLTPEILEKAGFVNRQNSCWWYLNIKVPDGFFYEDGYRKLEYDGKSTMGITEKPGGNLTLKVAGKLAESIEKDQGKPDDDAIVGINIEQHIWMTYKVEYLHQLQNLYFTLTGEELEINLNQHDNEQGN